MPYQGIDPCQHGTHLRLPNNKEAKPEAILQSFP